MSVSERSPLRPGPSFRAEVVGLDHSTRGGITRRGSWGCCAARPATGPTRGRWTLRTAIRGGREPGRIVADAAIDRDDHITV